MSIQVVLADDHPVVLAGLKSVIEQSGRDIAVVGDADNGKEVMSIAENTWVDVFLLDIEMPFLNGLETAERLIRKKPKAKIIILSLHDTLLYVDRAVRAGVKGYVLKDSATEDVIQAIEEVHRGNFFMSPSISKYIVGGFLGRINPKMTKPVGDGLTNREREILQLIGEGLTNKEIARRLNIFLNTVQAHRRNLMHKLDIHKQADLIRYAIKQGVAKI